MGLLFYLSLPLHGPKNIYLEPADAGGIITQLAQKGYDVGPIDRWILSALGQPIGGWVYLGKHQIGRWELLVRIVTAKSHFSNVTLIPGETTVLFLDQLARARNLQAPLLQKYYHRFSPFPEAGILADTYHVPITLKEKGIMRMLTRLSLNRYRTLSRKSLGSWDPKTWQKILTIASIIQKEAAHTEEMPKIASVIFNRLKLHMRLQMDGTLNYGRYSHTRVTPQRIQNDRSTFNTYKHKGLPGSPVCNVSIAAIRAALHPASTTYLYFMKNDRGTHDFSRTYKGHLKNVKERRKD